MLILLQLSHGTADAMEALIAALLKELNSGGACLVRFRRRKTQARTKTPKFLPFVHQPVPLGPQAPHAPPAADPGSVSLCASSPMQEANGVSDTKEITGGKFANGATTASLAQAVNGNDDVKRRVAAQEDPSFAQALTDKEFWKLYAQGVKVLGLATGKMLLGEASAYSGWILSKVPGGQITGTYLMADGASLFAGGMSDVSNLFYGTSVDYDFMGAAYRNAGEFYFGNAAYGDVARSSVGLGAIFRANTIPVTITMNSSAWGNSVLTYTATVPAFYTSNNVLRAADAVGVAQGVRSLNQ